MTKRYHKEVTKLVASLSSTDHREEAAGLLRELVDKVVFTPTEDGQDYIIDLVGDLAGIISFVSQSKDQDLIDKGACFLTVNDKDLSASQEAMVVRADCNVGGPPRFK